MTERNDPTKGADILAYYEQSYDEEGRLTRGSGQLEFVRMQELLTRFLTPAPGVVLDVGGGPGMYSCWLARQGYEVHLVDPVTKHLEQARRASALQPEHPIASVKEGDARSLSQEDESCDVVLLMGPLYHLTERDDRLTALREAFRVLRPGGTVVAIAVHRFASLHMGLMQGLIDDPSYVALIGRELEDGQHRSPKDREYFTTAFFHLPEELESEVREAGFVADQLLPVQGPGILANDLEERLSDPGLRKTLLALIRSVETERSLLGISPHIVVVAQKPRPQ
jgi:ubiquinone/menaquinone biosynthesis C-methylase UbiE